MHIYVIRKGEEARPIDELPAKAVEISIEDLKLEIQKTEKVYFFGMKGLNEKLFKRVYVNNKWRDFRRLTEGGWSAMVVLPDVALEYEAGKVPEQLKWDYQNMPGDFSTIYRRTQI